jgi:GT2 family glycosyltransferase
MFLDADDLLFPNAFEALSRASTQWSSAWAINPRYEVMKPDGATARGPTHRREVYDRSHLAQVLMKNPFAGNMLMRRAVWEEHPYSEDQELRYCEDLELWIRLLLAGGRIVIPPEILIQRREARPGASTGQLRSMRRDRHRLFTRMRHEPRLNPLERAVVRYQIVRTSIGRRVLDSRFGAREPSR